MEICCNLVGEEITCDVIHSQGSIKQLVNNTLIIIFYTTVHVVILLHIFYIMLNSKDLSKQNYVTVSVV